MLSRILEDLEKITSLPKEISVLYLMRKYKFSLERAIIHAEEYFNAQKDKSDREEREIGF